MSNWRRGGGGDRGCESVVGARNDGIESRTDAPSRQMQGSRLPSPLALGMRESAPPSVVAKHERNPPARLAKKPSALTSTSTLTLDETGMSKPDGLREAGAENEARSQATTQG